MDHVLSKVKRHPMYSIDDLEAQERTARNLVDPANIKSRFAHLLDVQPLVEDIRDGDECNLQHSMEVRNLHRQQKNTAAQAASLPVKLFLSKLRRGPPPGAIPLTTLLRFRFGPLHAGLVVGNITIEWDDSSLIVPLPEPPQSDFIANVQSMGSWQKEARQVVKDMSLANRRNMDTPKKLEIIYKTREEKERIIDRLVDVIVKYNRCKKYSVLSCNCQHFVTDALEALHIHGTAQFRFEGNLGRYFDALKRGKEGGGLQFDTHEQLDAHVMAHLRRLDKREKEFLLCLYFQFHALELAPLTPEEQEKWQCQVPTCQCQELEYQVENEFLFFHEFEGQNAPASLPAASLQVATPSVAMYPAVSPGARDRQLGMPAVKEEEEEGEGQGVRASPGRVGGIQEVGEDAAEGGNEATDDAVLKEFLDRDDSPADQGQRLAKFSVGGYHSKMKAKLESHPAYQGKSEAEIMTDTEILTEKECFRKAYLSELLINETCMDVVAEVSLEDSSNPQLSKQELKESAGRRFKKLFNMNFKMNLVLRPYTRHDPKKATVKAPIKLGLQVGDYVYEWNETSVIIPWRLQADSEPRILSPVLQKSLWYGVVNKEKDNVDQSIEAADSSMQIILHFELTQERDQLLEKFIDTVLRYNRKNTYSSRSCSNITFLKDALLSLGVREPGKLVSKSIKEHIGHLKPSSSISRKPLHTHQQLDTVVAELDEGSLSRGDIEYLVAKYYLFHVEVWVQGGQGTSAADKWQCSVTGCRLGQVQSLLTNITTI